jgi:PPOX class probable F420-dependent enzyme
MMKYNFNCDKELRMTSAHSVIPARLADLLASKALANVATLGQAGDPQVTPVWFGWDGEYIRFSTLKARQKYKNVVRDPRIALAIVDVTDPLRYLEIRGTVVRIEDDRELAFINAMAQKYLGLAKYPWHKPGHERVTIVIRPDKTTTQS